MAWKWRWGAILLLLGGALSIMPRPTQASEIERIGNIHVSEQGQTPVNARARAFSRALREGVARAWALHVRDRPLPFTAPESVQAAVAYVDVLDEAISPSSYSARYSVGVNLDVLARWAGSSFAPASTPIAEGTPEAPHTAPTIRIEGAPIPLGAPGALATYRQQLAKSGAHWTTIRRDKDGVLGLTLRNPENRRILSVTPIE